MTTRQQKGQAGEDAAAAYLTRHGLRLVERNFRVRGGEIDLICQDGDTLVFVEVRARKVGGFGGAAESITAAKRGRLIRTAELYLAGLARQPACRFDAVLIDGERLTWLRNAFEVG